MQLVITTIFENKPNIQYNITVSTINNISGSRVFLTSMYNMTHSMSKKT